MPAFPFSVSCTDLMQEQQEDPTLTELFQQVRPVEEMESVAHVYLILTQFISVVGIPKLIQSDQGTNFTSCLFADILKELHIKHTQSTAYHPESQGAIERFHQTLKSLLHSYCTELGRDWEEGLPWLMLGNTREYWF